jgi:hypothetical protein
MVQFHYSKGNHRNRTAIYLSQPQTIAEDMTCHGTTLSMILPDLSKKCINDRYNFSANDCGVDFKKKMYIFLIGIS